MRDLNLSQSDKFEIQTKRLSRVISKNELSDYPKSVKRLIRVTNNKR